MDLAYEREKWCYNLIVVTYCIKFFQIYCAYVYNFFNRVPLGCCFVHRVNCTREVRGKVIFPFVVLFIY